MMSPDGGSAFFIGLWIVLFALLLIWILVFLLEYYWRRQIESLSRKVVPGFNHVQNECRQIIVSTRQYSHDDPPPYGALAASVQRKLDQIANQLVDLKREYIHIQERLGKIRFRIWKRLLSAPFYWYDWYKLEIATTGLLKGIAGLIEQINAAWDGVRSIDRQAWLVAQNAQEVLVLEREVRRLMESLGDRKLTGDKFEEAALQEEKVIDALDIVPRYFFTMDENNINQHATKESVCSVYAIVVEVRPVIKDLLVRLSAWDKQYKALESKALQMHQQIDRTQNLISSLPDNLIVSKEIDQMTSMKTIADALSATMLRLEIDSIPEVGGEIDRIGRATVEMGGGIRRGLRQYGSLSTMIGNALLVQKDLSALISSLAKSEIHPVIWDQSQSVFREINKQIAALGETHQPRSIEEIDRNFSRASELSERLNKISEHCHEIAAQHAEVLGLLASEDIQHGLEWCKGAEAISTQVAVYNPNNWSRQEAVATLQEDLRYLMTRHQSIISVDDKKSLKESEITGLLADVKLLSEDYNFAHTRVGKVEARLRWIQSIEKETKDHFYSARNQFHQISWLVNSNPYLKKAAGADLDRIRNVLERNNQGLSQPQAGLIEKKAREAEAVIEEVVVCTNRWLVQLNQDIQSKQQTLTDKLNKLQEYAALEDPSIDKARRLLAKDTHKTSTAQVARQKPLALVEVVNEMQQRCNIWQEYVAVQQELEEVVETPLIDAVLNAEKQRQRALDLLAVANRQIPVNHTWPPTDVSVASERRNIEQMEVQWKAMKSQQVRAIWAVRRYGELAASYQAQASKIEQAIQWVSQEQKRVIDVEVEIERLLRYLQRQELSASSDPQKVEKYNQIRSKAALSLEDVKERWTSGSGVTKEGLDCDDIVQELLDVLNRLRTTVQNND
jgi:hypothetical protein